MAFDVGGVADRALARIQKLFLKLRAMPFPPTKRQETPEYRALIAEIRAEVDARTAERGDEMIEVVGHPPNEGGRRHD